MIFINCALKWKDLFLLSILNFSAKINARSIFESRKNLLLRDSLTGICQHYLEFHETTRNLRIWSHLLKKYLMENFIFCAVFVLYFPCHLHYGLLNFVINSCHTTGLFPYPIENVRKRRFFRCFQGV